MHAELYSRNTNKAIEAFLPELLVPVEIDHSIGQLNTFAKDRDGDLPLVAWIKTEEHRTPLTVHFGIDSSDLGFVEKGCGHSKGLFLAAGRRNGVVTVLRLHVRMNATVPYQGSTHPA